MAIEFNKYKALRTAIEFGDWETALGIFNEDEYALIGRLDENGSTVLHLTVRNLDNTTFLDKLLDHMKEKKMPLLELFDDGNFTVLQEAVLFDNKYAVKKLVDKEKHLLFRLKGWGGDLPLLSAAISGERTTFEYLFEACKQHIGLLTTPDDKYRNPFKGEACFLLFNFTIMSGYFDVSYVLLKDHYDELNNTDDPLPGDTLYYLARKPNAFLSGKLPYNIWQSDSYSRRRLVSIPNYLGDFIKLVGMRIRKTSDIENQETKTTNPAARKSYIESVPYIKTLNEEKVQHNRVLTILKFICEKDGRLENTVDKQQRFERALILAVENDIPEVIETITREFPQSIKILKDDKSLIELSIINRSGKAYHILAQAYPRDMRNRVNYKLLDLVGNLNLTPQEKLNMVPGAALQMQMELKWFEEVRNFVDRHELKNNLDIEKGTQYDQQRGKEISRMVFKKEHEGLRQKGEEWMKKTADSYTITAALIITIVFAAAITVPGGNNGETGKAIYKTRASFIVFIVSDAISFFTSTTSLLLFLSILTARYEHEDFLYKLPKRLILGLVMLFMSVTTMLIAFSAALYIMSGQENRWILVPITAITCLPIVSFVTLQLPLLYDLISSTYCNRIFGKRL
ncbi:uncharacterized protein LOC143545028 [Bidens hawaiensis]|uniref:uncharacterized protein LOC143545028 n=1 Tax=Bidens hawaiensis TaxID=980011 RepID=UPI00404AD915